MNSTNQSLTTNLWSTAQGADKVYHLYLREKQGGWTADYVNGKRGGTLSTGTLTAAPVPYEVALKKYSDKLKSKLKDGYTLVEGGEAYTASEFAGRATGIEVQLLTSIDERRCMELLDDDDFVAQVKANGERRLIFINAGTVTGANRKGLLVDVPAKWQAQFGAIGDAILDGEHVGDKFCAFDIISHAGEDLRSRSFCDRYERLTTVLGGLPSKPDCLQLLQTSSTSFHKRGLLSYVRENKLEGLVFQRRSAPYLAGRSLDSFKFKLVEQITCIVISRNTQRSVVLGLFDNDGNLIPQGNVTIPVNHVIPEVDALVDVTFLYWTGQAFEQPVFERVRTDLDREDARIDQITRIKPTEQVAMLV
jgi:bifunctional non-homologous end joining protein LigD